MASLFLPLSRSFLQIGKISGTVDKTVVPGVKTINQEIKDAKSLAIQRCVAAGGNEETVEVVEVDFVPMSYVTNGATRILVRVVGDLVHGYEEGFDSPELSLEEGSQKTIPRLSSSGSEIQPISKGDSYNIIDKVDIQSYRPRIEGDLWYLSEMDLQFLQDGTGVLGVGSCGEPYPAYLACVLALQYGDITVRRQDSIPDDAVVLVGGFIVRVVLYLLPFAKV
jgi:hypothetical protein